MSVKPFYEIDPSSYLFGKKFTPEERVRQWALFELLSTYGVNIKNLQVEVSVKVGSKRYRADIVVYKEHVPYVVVECKETDFKGDDETVIQQAISYAIFLRAKFVVFTNGNKWQVKYHYEDNWTPVIDIPNQIDDIAYEDVNSLIDLSQAISPLLFWIYKPIPKQQSSKFLYFLQTFFSYEKNLFYGVDRDLLHGAEVLLRVSGIQNSNSATKDFEFGEYQKDKILEAYNILSRYLTKTGLASNIVSFAEFRNYAPAEVCGHIISEFYELAKDLPSNSDMDERRLIRFIVSITQYTKLLIEEGDFQEIPESILGEFIGFANRFLITKYGVKVPDRLSLARVRELRTLCSAEWKM